MKRYGWKQSICQGLCCVIAGLCMALGASISGQAAYETGHTNYRASMGTVAESEKALQITMLNVEKADAILLQYQGHAMLIDTGLEETQDRLLKLLRDKNVTVLDAVLLSHPHTDHMGGLKAVLDEVPVRQVYDNGQMSKNTYYENYRQQVALRNIPRRVLRKGDDISWGNDINIHVLSPAKLFTAKDLPNASATGICNNNSIVCRVTYGTFSMLFTGDAQKTAERQLLKEPAGLSANVLKIGHHGSKTSTLPEFVEAVHPDCAVISCSRYRPVPESKQYALSTLEARHIPVYQTSQQGTITIRSDGTTYEIQTEHS